MQTCLGWWKYKSIWIRKQLIKHLGDRTGSRTAKFYAMQKWGTKLNNRLRKHTWIFEWTTQLFLRGFSPPALALTRENLKNLLNYDEKIYANFAYLNALSGVELSGKHEWKEQWATRHSIISWIPFRTKCSKITLISFVCNWKMVIIKTADNFYRKLPKLELLDRSSRVVPLVVKIQHNN